MGGGGVNSTFSLTNSTISNNSTIDGNGGGLNISTNNASIINSTISGNQALEGDAAPYGGGIFHNSVLEISNSTLTNNQAGGTGGGIYDGSTTTMRNTIIALNSDNGTAPDCISENTINSDGYNLIGTDTGCSITPPKGDNNSTDIYDVDPLLGPLQNNGGPTLTHALLQGSPAIDAANPNGCEDELNNVLTSDQRGQTRPINNRCDIGAYEASIGADVSVVKTTDLTQVEIGDELTYTITATNLGPDKAFNVKISDEVPTNFTIIEATSDKGACQINGNLVECEVAELTLNEEMVVSIKVQAITEGQTTNIAVVSNTEPDPDEGNNTTPGTDVTVGPGGETADLSLSKTASKSQVEINEEYTYTLSLSNAGPAIATDIELTDNVPASLEIISIDPAEPDCSITGQLVSCEITALNANETFEVVITVRATQSGLIDNTASAAGAQNDPNPGNSSSTATVTVGSGTFLEGSGGCSLSKQATQSATGFLWILGIVPMVLIAKRSRQMR